MLSLRKKAHRLCDLMTTTNFNGCDLPAGHPAVGAAAMAALLQLAGCSNLTISEDPDTEYARSGVYVTARVSGEEVMLDIAPALQSFSSDDTRQSVSAHTTLTARIGQWITIAAVDTVSSGDARGAAGSQTRSGTQGYLTQVKVTVLD